MKLMWGIIIVVIIIVGVVFGMAIIDQQECKKEILNIGGKARYTAYANDYCTAIMPDGSLKVLRRLR